LTLIFPREFSEVIASFAVESVFIGMFTVRSSETGSMATADAPGANRS